LFRNRINEFRTLLKAVDQNLKSKEKNSSIMNTFRTYKDDIIVQMFEACKYLVSALDDHALALIPKTDIDEKIYFLTLQGDLWRYLLNILCLTLKPLTLKALSRESNQRPQEKHVIKNILMLKSFVEMIKRTLAVMLLDYTLC